MVELGRAAAMPIPVSGDGPESPQQPEPEKSSRKPISNKSWYASPLIGG